MKVSYPRDISIIASIFIFLILFLALVNLYISIQLRNEFIGYDRDKIVSIASVCAGYLNRHANNDELDYFLRNLTNAFALNHLIISDTLGNKIFDSWSMRLGFRFPQEKFDYTGYFDRLPKAYEIIHKRNNFIYFDPLPGFYLYTSFSPASLELFDKIFKWHIFYITISLFFVGFLGIFLIRNLFMPMRYAANIARELGVEMRKEDFVSETFNEMLRKIKMKEEMLVEFSSYIAHEFRNSIGTIIGLVRLVEKGKKPAACIVKECRDMEDLINRLLEYSRPVKPMVSLVGVAQLIADVISRISIPKRIMIRRTIKSDLLVIKGDYDLLHSALMNLLKNSIEAIPKKGFIEITAGIENDLPFITITDNGCGLTPSELEKIFSPFYSKKEKGLGLGLAYVKKIVELHNGRIEVKSQKDNGTTFTLKFPAPK